VSTANHLGAPASDLSPTLASSMAGSGALRALRAEAASRLENTRMPTEALEDWRYSRISSLDLAQFCLVQEPPSVPPDREGTLASRLESAVSPDLVLRSLDGHFLAPPEAPEPLELQGEGLLGADDLGADELYQDFFALLNRAFAPAPLGLRVRAGQARKVVVEHWVSADSALVLPRLEVELEPGASLSLLEVLSGPGASLVVPVSRFELADRARLDYLVLQDLAPRAWQLGLAYARLGAEADLALFAAALGGHYARLRTVSVLEGQASSGRLGALYFAAGDQMHDFRTLQAHLGRRSRSELLYKGVVANSARSVYSGLIRVEKGAAGTNAFQTNRNLVLHEGAHADSVPNLEIEDNDVRCSHASAVGPVDPDQLFYLESRGVPTPAAERLIALGFLGEVLDALPIPEAAGVLRQAIAAKLDRAEATQRELALGGDSTTGGAR